MKRFRKIYIEITSVCNLNCSFCPGTTREKKFVTPEEFEFVIKSVSPLTDYVYFHLMGEPLLHPQLGEFMDIAAENGIKVCLTTNGTLLKEKAKVLIPRIDKIHKISVSLQAQEANDGRIELGKYLQDCFAFGKEIEGKTILVYRLWNEGGRNENNSEILAAMHSAFPGEWIERPRGNTIANKIFLENGQKFDWPDPEADYFGNPNSRYYCYGLNDHIGILADGTVVPCCLDNDGRLALGNIYTESLESILNNNKALGIAEGFKNGFAAEDLCKRCGYATRFVK